MLMGIVKMSEKITGEWEDLNGTYPYAEATLYIYCDHCGSFNIKTHIGYRKASLIMFAGVLLVVGILALRQLTGGIYWFGLCLAVSILAFRYLWGNPDYVCRECGGIPSTRFNTLGYPSDVGILVIPDRLTHKKYRGYYPDDYDMDKAMMSPPGLLPEVESAVSRILGDFEYIKTSLLFFLTIPLFIIATLIYPIGLIIYVVWAEVMDKLIASKSSRRNG